MFVFGGCSKDYAAMEDLWKLKLGEKKAQWTRVEPIGFPPPARWLHTADVIQSDVRIDLGLGWLCWLCWKQSNVCNVAELLLFSLCFFFLFNSLSRLGHGDLWQCSSTPAPPAAARCKTCGSFVRTTRVGWRSKPCWTPPSQERAMRRWCWNPKPPHCDEDGCWWTGPATWTSPPVYVTPVYMFFVENTFCFVYMILILKFFVANFFGYFF